MKRVTLPGLILCLVILSQRAGAEGAPPPVAGTFMDGWTYVNELQDPHEHITLMHGKTAMWGPNCGVPRSNVWMSSPAGGDRPFKWLRTVAIKKGVNAGLHFEVTSSKPVVGKPISFRLVVMANEQSLVDKIIDTKQWYTFDLDLSQFDGQSVNLELWNADDGKWWYEIAFWSNVCFLPNVGGTAANSGSKPTITTQPANITVAAGQTATFSVKGAGAGILTYQWQQNGQDIPGATSASYSLTANQTAKDAQFCCVVKNAAGAAKSQPAVLTVKPAGPAPEVCAAWDAKLQARLREDLKAGKKLVLNPKDPANARPLSSVDDSGNVNLELAKGVQGKIPWAKLESTEKAVLALEVKHADDPAAQCLAAFYLLAAGRDADAVGISAPGRQGSRFFARRFQIEQFMD